jgi:hypothetical protein
MGKTDQQNHKYWTVPRIWDGDTCFILGGGPSLAKINVDSLQGKGRVIAVNCAYRLGNWFEAMFYGDRYWLHQHGKDLDKFPGLKITANQDYPSDAWIESLGIKVIKRDLMANGISEDPALISWNQSSGACAINLAVLLGAGKIVLLGFDMKRVEGRTNYHDEYPPYGTAFDPFYKFLPAFDKIAEDLEILGIECLNATPDSAIKAFPIIDIGDVC